MPEGQGCAWNVLEQGAIAHIRLVILEAAALTIKIMNTLPINMIVIIKLLYYIYIYIYTYIHISISLSLYIYIYMYIYIERER